MFAAAVDRVVSDTDLWSQELARYEFAYNDVRQYFLAPVDEGRVPSNAILLEIKDGYRRYQLPETGAYLFGVTSAEQRKELMERTDFLFRLLCSSGQQYSIRPIDEKLADFSRVGFATTSEGFCRILQILFAIANKLKNQDYVDERDLNRLFSFIDGSIDDLNKSKSSQDLIDLMYIPIKEWITDDFPVSPMLKYIENSAGDLSKRASGGYNVFVNHAFKYGSYFINIIRKHQNLNHYQLKLVGCNYRLEVSDYSKEILERLFDWKESV